MSLAGKRMEMEIMMLSKISQTRNDKYCRSFFVATREPPATFTGTAWRGETQGCGRGGTGGSGGDKGQELGVPAATLLQTPGLTRGPVALNIPSSPVSQIRPTLTTPGCRVSCCPTPALGVSVTERFLSCLTPHNSQVSDTTMAVAPGGRPLPLLRA
jgi:hypothetical protein